MIITNIRNKVINIGSSMVLPDESIEISDDYRNNGVISKLAKMGFIKVEEESSAGTDEEANRLAAEEAEKKKAAADKAAKKKAAAEKKAAEKAAAEKAAAEKEATDKNANIEDGKN